MTKHDPMVVIGCDFRASSKAGLQAKKTILIEAERIADKTYRCHNTGRNERLVTKCQFPPKRLSASWKQNRPCWTIVDLADSLAHDPFIAAAAFDFPFSIPWSLLPRSRRLSTSKCLAIEPLGSPFYSNSSPYTLNPKTLPPL